LIASALIAHNEAGSIPLGFRHVLRELDEFQIASAAGNETGNPQVCRFSKARDGAEIFLGVAHLCRHVRMNEAAEINDEGCADFHSGFSSRVNIGWPEVVAASLSNFTPEVSRGWLQKPRDEREKARNLDASAGNRRPWTSEFGS